MSSLEERVAVLEALAEQQAKDRDSFFSILRRHMEKEEKDREEIKGEIKDLALMQQRQKSFVGGVIFTVTSVWAVLLGFFMLLKGS